MLYRRWCKLLGALASTRYPLKNADTLLVRGGTKSVGLAPAALSKCLCAYVAVIFANQNERLPSRHDASEISSTKNLFLTKSGRSIRNDSVNSLACGCNGFRDVLEVCQRTWDCLRRRSSMRDIRTSSFSSLQVALGLWNHQRLLLLDIGIIFLLLSSTELKS